MSESVTNPAAIPEAERRWADFQGGIPIELPDGQRWWFCQPEARIRSGIAGWTFGPEVPQDIDLILSARLSKILRKWGRARDDAERAATIVEAAWFLLARNYNITPAEFKAILLPAAAWDDVRQARLGHALASLVNVECVRAVALLEVA